MPQPDLITITNSLPDQVSYNDLNVTRVDLTAAQMLTIGSVPKLVLPAITNYTYFLRQFVIFKQTGAAFTFGAQTMIFRYFSTVVNIGTFTPTGTLDQTTETTMIASLNIPIAINGTAPNPGSGKGVEVTTSTGVDFGGTGSSCTILIGYYLYPTTLSVVGY